MQDCNFACCSLLVGILGSHTEGRTQIEAVREQPVEENI
jgi:hypothetical protein